MQELICEAINFNLVKLIIKFSPGAIPEPKKKYTGEFLKVSSFKSNFLQRPGLQPWSNMTMMLCHGMNMVFHTHHDMVMAISWHICHGCRAT